MSSVVTFAKLVNDDCINTISNAGFRPQPSGLVAVRFRQEIGIEDTRINIDLPLGADPTARILMGIERTPFNPMVVIARAEDFRHPSFGIVCPQPFIHGSHGRWKITLSGGFRGAEGGCLTLLLHSSSYARGGLHVRPHRRCGYNLDELSRFALGEAELAKDRGVSS
jgi:hypothetical protein